MIPLFHTRFRYAVLALAVVLAGDTLAHVDDVDGLYYRDIGGRALASGDWFHLAWSQQPSSAFHEHLAPGLWLIGASNALGHTGQRALFGAMCALTLLLLAALAQKRFGDRAAELTLWVAIATEGFMRWQPQPRLDPPFLLAWVAALFLAGDFALLQALAAGAAVGVAAVLRPPPSLALLLLVPLLVAFDRRVRDASLVRVRDAAALLVFLLAACAPLAAFAWADAKWGSSDALRDYWQVQVHASLSGARSDGQSSHLAPLRTMLDKFWPGNALILIGAIVAWRKRERVPMALWYFVAWAVLVVAGFSLGRRHVGTHVWPAYLALFVVAGWASSICVREAWLARVRSCLLVAAVIFTAIFAPLQKRYCDVATFAAQVEAAHSCGDLLVENGDWITAHRVVDHYVRAMRFVDADAPPPASACPTLLIAKHAAPPWITLQKGRSRNLYVSPPAASDRPTRN